MADGKEVRADTLWRWIPYGGGHGHLRNQMSRGHLNSRPEGFVRGHGNRGGQAAASQDKTTELKRMGVDYDRYQESSRSCQPGETFALKFVTSGFVHVTQDGIIWAKVRDCANCLLLPPC